MEENVLFCLIKDNKLFSNLKVNEDHFIKFKRTFNYIQVFYKKFGNTDVSLMLPKAGINSTELFQYSKTDHKFHLQNLSIPIHKRLPDAGKKAG